MTESMQSSRSGAAVVAHNGYIYVLGGIQGVEKGFLKSVERARIKQDGSLGKWETISKMNIKKGFTSAAVLNDYIYVLGGANNEGQMTLLNVVERARIKQDGSLGKWETVASMTTPRRGVTAAAYKNHLFAIGGYNGTFLKTVETASTDTNNKLSTWSVIPQPMRVNRYIHGATVTGNRIYVIGGHMRQRESATNSSEWTSILDNGMLTEWTEGAPMTTARFLTGVTATKDMIVVAGGYSSTYLDDVETADIGPEGGIVSWQSAPPLLNAREGAGVVAYKNYVYVIGGSQKGIYLKDVEYAGIR